VEIGTVVGAKYLITFTQSGDTAKRLSRMRTQIPMLAFTPEQAVRSQLALSWGIETYLVPPPRHTDHYALEVDQTLLPSGVLKQGDLVVIVAGSPPGIPGSTNALRVHRMGDAVNKVAPAYEDIDEEELGSAS
jgi:pyruvate kinase